MSELIELLKQESEQLSKEDKKGFLKFISRLNKYSHVPSNKKEISRMDVFSEDAIIVNSVIKCLRVYPNSRHENISDHKRRDFDIISYYYCIALLLRSNYEQAISFIDELVYAYIQEKHDDLWQFRRLLNCIDSAVYQTAKSKVNNFFIKIQKYSEFYLWANKIGLELPEDDSWLVYFEINTLGEFVTPYSVKDKENHYSLRVTVHPLENVRNDCFRIQLNNMSGTVRNMWFANNNQKIKINGESTALDSQVSLINLKVFLKEIENKLNISFSRKIISKEFRGRINNKNAVQKWLSE